MNSAKEEGERRALKARIAELEKRVAELELGAAPTTAPGKSLADAVAKWKQERPMANEPPDSTAKELNAKFAASGGTFTFTYGDVTFFKINEVRSLPR